MEEKIFVCREKRARADIFLSEQLTNLTRSAVKKLFDDGLVTICGKGAKAAHKVEEGDEVKVLLPEPKPDTAVPQNIPIDIIYQDEDLAVINKPQGLAVHAGNGNADKTLVNALLYNLDNLSGIGGVIRPGIVHRIDKNTSGLLVVAKNDKAHLSLAGQIAEKTCRRTYMALLEGNVKEDSGRISTYIGRSPSDRVKMAVVPPDKGKIAITDFTVIERRGGYTLCRFDLQTGRTHQIRVHAKYMNHPVVGDDVYGRKKREFGLGGQLLHAYALQFVHPTTGETMRFCAPLPDYFVSVLKKLGFENFSL